MTDESHDAEMEEQVTPDAGGDFSSGEGLVAFAGIVLLANFVIFELILSDYFLSYPLLLLAVGAVMLPRVRRESVEAFHPLGHLMKAIGYAIVVLGVFEVLDDIRFDGYDEAAAVIGALVAYAGYAMAFMGARSIET